MSDSAFPIQLSERMAQLPDYMMEKINKLRQAKRREGVDLIDMSMGNPRDPTPQPIVEKLAEAVQDPRNHRYSVATGIHNLRNELSKYYAAQYDVGLDPESQVIATIGSKEGFSHLCLALIGQGDRFRPSAIRQASHLGLQNLLDLGLDRLAEVLSLRADGTGRSDGRLGGHGQGMAGQRDHGHHAGLRPVRLGREGHRRRLRGGRRSQERRQR